MITIFNLFNWSFNLETYIERCVCRYIIRRVGENLPIKSYPTLIIHHLLPYLLSYINQCLSSIKDILSLCISFFLKSSVFFSNNYSSIVCVCVCVRHGRPLLPPIPLNLTQSMPLMWVFYCIITSPFTLALGKWLNVDKNSSLYFNEWRSKDRNPCNYFV